MHGRKAGRGSFVSVQPVQLPGAPCLEGAVITSPLSYGCLTILKNFGTGSPAFSCCTVSANHGAGSGSSCHSLSTQFDVFHRSGWPLRQGGRN